MLDDIKPGTHVVLNGWMAVPESEGLRIVYEAREAGDVGVFSIPFRLAIAAPELLSFVIQYLYSEHGECYPEDEACPYSPEQLGEMARKLIAKATGRE